MADSFVKTIAGHSLELDLTMAGRSADRRLADLCTDLLLIVIRMREAEDLGEPESLRMLIRHYIDLFEKNCDAMGVETSRSRSAAYALVALLDETVLSQPGPCRDSWLANPLQLEKFGDNLAGEEFYRKLDDLLGAQRPDRELLEVYYLCLCLGFAGKYLLSNAEQREQTIARIAAILDKGRPGRRTAESLSPHAFRKTLSVVPHRPRRTRTLWIAGIAAVAVIALGWVVSSAMVGAAVERLVGG
jgi:type VI secretion system protein ImpK